MNMDGKSITMNGLALWAGRLPAGCQAFGGAPRSHRTRVACRAKGPSYDKFDPRLNIFKHMNRDDPGPKITAQEFWETIMEAQKVGKREEREQGKGRPRQPEDWVPLSADEAARSLKMGSWRLKGRMHPQMEALVAQIEAAWRATFQGDFKLFLTPLRLKFWDSMDPDQENPTSYGDVIDPADDGPDFPRFLLENRAYRTRVFRKCLIQLTYRQDEFQTLFCVMYPRTNFDLPILMLQITADEEGIKIAFIDACPATPLRQLPPFYAGPMRDTQVRFRVSSINQGPTPHWAKEICSPLAVCLEPLSPEQQADTIKYIVALVRYHTEVGKILNPITQNESARRRQGTVQIAQERFREENLAKNNEITSLIGKAFEMGWATAFAREVMFDSHTSAGDVNLDDD